MTEAERFGHGGWKGGSTVRVTFETEPGSSTIDNEDFVSATCDLAVVLDGVTPMDRADTGCHHGVAWYARNLGAELVTLAADDAVSLADCLAEAIVRTRDAHAGTCDLAHPDSPAATVAAARVRDGSLDYLVLADSAVVLDIGDEIQVVTDHRAGQVGRRLSANGGRPTAAQVRSHRNRPDGYWVAAERPDSAYEAIVGTIETTGLRRLMVASDGATRLVDTFGTVDWRDALDALQDSGPRAWIAATRAAERADAQADASTRRGRGKVHDDASVVLLTFTSS